MTFSLYVDEPRWRNHLRATVEATPGIVPVIKGNGYGLGNVRLAAEAAALGVDTVAVGTTDELPAVREAFPGDVLVLTPSYPRPLRRPHGTRHPDRGAPRDGAVGRRGASRRGGHDLDAPARARRRRRRRAGLVAG